MLNINDTLLKIETIFPNAGCELKYNNMYELIVSVVLSAQTTDVRVNKIGVELYKNYPDVYSLAKANYLDVVEIIKPLGLAKSKTTNIINLAKEIVDKFKGIIPATFDELITLPGVGRKTANVVLSVGFNIQRIAVDTHVDRVSKRLGFAEENDSVLVVEEKLMKLVDSTKWDKTHHLLLWHGRYVCLAKKPKCNECILQCDCNSSDKI